jgi:IS30 family transposase
MSIEQRYVIKYWRDEQLSGKQIIEKLKEHYGADVPTSQDVYYWLHELKCGRTDLHNKPPSGKKRIEELAGKVADEIEKDPHASARQIARVLGVSPGSVRNRLTNNLGMRCCHLRWVPHTLTSEQKRKRAEMAKNMLDELQMHVESHFSFIYTGDESWMKYSYPYKTEWISKWEWPKKVERNSHVQRKIMFTVFFNGQDNYDGGGRYHG